MKEVKAYIKPHKLTPVILALHKLDGVTGISILDGRGQGRGRAAHASDRVIKDMVNYAPHARIEIVCSDKLAEAVVNTIQEAAHTGTRGDGKIYVTNVETAVRISTGERGDQAI